MGRWRREWDSNPRCRYKRHTRFPVVLLQPTRTSLRMIKTPQHGCRERLPRIRRLSSSENWRRGWDSNPRSRVNGIPLFESGAFSHSATSPHPDLVQHRVGIGLHTAFDCGCQWPNSASVSITHCLPHCRLIASFPAGTEAGPTFSACDNRDVDDLRRAGLCPGRHEPFLVPYLLILVEPRQWRYAINVN